MILCTGGESCGTRLAAQIIEGLGGQALHQSVPHDRQWPRLDRFEFEAAIVMTRDWWCAMPSQMAAQHVATCLGAEHNLRNAYTAITAQLNALDRPWRFVSYEALTAEPREVITNLAEWLDLDAPGEDLVNTIRDENRKWR